MSHHFDTKLAKEDPSLNVCDFYLFEGAPGTTVMAMTVNPDVGLSTPDTLHIEGLYAFRFDLNEMHARKSYSSSDLASLDTRIATSMYTFRISRCGGQPAKRFAGTPVKC